MITSTKWTAKEEESTAKRQQQSCTSHYWLSTRQDYLAECSTNLVN